MMEQNTGEQQVPHYEAVHEHPDLLEIYGEKEVTLYGVTASIDSLSALCPVEPSQRSQEANNQFVISALNEAEAEILPEHEDYFMVELSRRGLEPKIKIHPEQSEMSDEQLAQGQTMEKLSVSGQEPRSLQASRETPLYASKNDEVADRNTVRFVENTQLPFPDVPITVREKLMALFNAPQFAPTEIVIKARGDDSLPAPEPIRTTAEVVTTATTAALPGEVLALAEDAGEDIVGAKTQVSADLGATHRAAVLAGSTKSRVPLVSEPKIMASLHRSSAEIKVAKKLTEDDTDEATSTLSEFSLGTEANIIQEHVIEDAADETVEAALLPQCPLPPAELLESLSVDSLTAPASEEEILLSSNEFVHQLVEYIATIPEIPEFSAEKQPKVLMENAIETAIKIQHLQAGEHGMEIMQKAKQELALLCEQLLESVGIEPNEQIVANLVEKILTSDLSEVSTKKLSPQELARLGTHEYKLEEWFRKFKRLLDQSMHPHRLVGRIALSLAGTGTV